MHTDTDPIITLPTRTVGRPLLVAVHDVDDIDGPLQEAAGRASVENRALLVVVVRPPSPLTTDPLVHALRAALCGALSRAVAAAAARGRAGLDVQVAQVRGGRALTARRARRALDHRIDELTVRYDAERHPSRRSAR